MENRNRYTRDEERNAFVPNMREGLTFSEVAISMRFVETRKMLSVKFPTMHMFCKTCGAHWHNCCYTDMDPVCTGPINCAFEKETWE